MLFILGTLTTRTIKDHVCPFFPFQRVAYSPFEVLTGEARLTLERILGSLIYRRALIGSEGSKSLYYYSLSTAADLFSRALETGERGGTPPGFL
jgi:hypothetical protein